MHRETVISQMQDTYDACVSLAVVRNRDYASEDNPFSNFEFAGDMIGFFAVRGADNTTLSFVGLIGTKLARLAELQSRPPAGERIADTFMDAINYLELLHQYWNDIKEATNA